MNRDVIWELKAEQALNALKQGKRLDGRNFNEYRKIELMKDFSKNAEGSCWAKVGETEVVVGVKMVLGEPYPDSPDEGTISVGVELMPLASPEFESGPPGVDSIELARVVDRGIRESETIDFKKLCVKEGELVWIVFIDIYSVTFAGNLFDASQFATMVALNNTKIPKIEDDKIVLKEYAGKLEVLNQPVLTTFAKVGDKIVLDPELAEEKAMSARLSIATREDSKIAAFQKGLAGSFSKDEIVQCIDVSFEKAKEIRKLFK